MPRTSRPASGRIRATLAILIALAAVPAPQALAQPADGWGGWSLSLLGVVTDSTTTGASLQGNGSFGGSADLERANAFTRGGGGGLALGYQHQDRSGLMAGLEADWVALGHEERQNALAGSGVFAGMVAASIRRDVEWMSTARLRLGYVDGPWMVQATGGLALASLAQTRTQYEGVNGPVQTLARFSETDRALPLGWTIGLGGAWQLTEGWSLRLEYLHAQFDEVRFSFPNARGGAGGAFATVQGRDVRTDITMRMLRFGVTYTFGTGLSAGTGQDLAAVRD